MEHRPGDLASVTVSRDALLFLPILSIVGMKWAPRVRVVAPGYAEPCRQIQFQKQRSCVAPCLCYSWEAITRSPSLLHPTRSVRVKASCKGRVSTGTVQDRGSLGGRCALAHSGVISLPSPSHDCTCTQRRKGVSKKRAMECGPGHSFPRGSCRGKALEQGLEQCWSPQHFN